MARASRLLLPALAGAVLLGLLWPPAAGEAGDAERDAALLRGLQTRRLANVRFEATSLDDFVRWLRVATGHNLIVKRTALAKAGVDPAQVQVTLQLEDVTVGTLLEIVLDPHDLAVLVKDNIVWITTRLDALGPPVTKLYGISHITWTKTDFIAPEINLHPSDYVPTEEYEPERIVEDDPLRTGDAVVELLRELVAPDDWDTAGWVLRATDRYLVVRAPEPIHAQVVRALALVASLK